MHPSTCYLSVPLPENEVVFRTRNDIDFEKSLLRPMEVGVLSCVK